MRQIDQPHNAKNQCQTRRHQKQHHAELQTVQDLLYEKTCGHGEKVKERPREGPQGS